MNDKMQSYFIIRPRFGLCNQLQTIVHGVLLGHKYNRSVFIDGFQKDVFHPSDICPINDVIDTDKLNQILRKLQLHTSISLYINEALIEKMKHTDYNLIPYSKNICPDIEHPDNINIPYLDIGNPVNACFEDDLLDYHETYYHILINIPFQDHFYQKAQEIKNVLHLDNYDCIHLRIENDAINSFSEWFDLPQDVFNKRIIDQYQEYINQHTEKKIYICSGMLNFDNTINNDFYTQLFQRNQNLHDKRNIELDDYYKDNRECTAILDLIISLQSENFLGHFVSSFSILVDIHHKRNGKTSHLVRV